MKGARGWILAGLLAAAAGACTRPPPRDLVLIVVDTLRRDHLAVYGYGRETAPQASRLASEGAVLDGVSVSSWTLPATASLLTGMHPLRQGAVSGAPEALSDEAVTLARRLGERGYATLAVSANGYVSPKFGLDAGFDEFIVQHEVDAWTPGTGGQVNAHVRSRLDALTSPYFLYVHYVEPHASYDPEVAWDGGPLPPPLARGAPVRGPDFAREVLASPVAPERLTQVVDLYDGEIRTADERMGELLAALRARGLLDNAITVFTSDHGEEFTEHGLSGHGRSLYAEVVDVPLVFHAPGLVAGGTRHGRASLLDVVPTLAGLLGLPLAPEEVDGVDLSSHLRTGARYDGGARALLLHLDHAHGAALGLLQGSRKLILALGVKRRQLFDLSGDPGERDDLAATRGVEVGPLAQRLADRHNDLAERGLPPGRARSQDDAATGALAALGYVESRATRGRRIPRRIRVADAGPTGLLGWESPASCIETADDASASNLLEGWHAAELGGRWSAPSATVALRAPPGSGRLEARVRGVNHEAAPVEFRLRLDDRALGYPRVAPGAFDLSLPVMEGPRREWAVLRIDRRPAFVPARMGLKDDRRLGVFLTSVCLVRSASRTAAPAGGS